MITRRAATFGTLAAFAFSGGANAAPPKILFRIRVFIPSPAVRYLGDLFGGGDKAVVEGALDLGVTGPNALAVTTRYLGSTKRYQIDAARPVAGKPDWYVGLAAGAMPVATGQSPLTPASLSAVWDRTDGATHGVKIIVNAANPLLAGAPAIDASIRIALRPTASGAEYRIATEHDGFPSYRVELGVGEPVYDYDCVAAAETPLALFPPMERSFASTGWAGLAT